MMKEFVLRNGISVPAIGYGTWRMPGSQECEDTILQAIETGYRHIDTAAMYQNEDSVGRAVLRSGVARKKFFITSKLWNTEHTYEKTMAAFEQTLERLQTNYLDLYLIHWPKPAAFAHCWEQANADTWCAMEDLYYAGKIRAIGVSNFLPHHIEALKKTARVLPMVNQIELHPGCMQQETVYYCRANHIQVEAWGPLAVGEVLKHPTVLQLAEENECTPAQLILSWFVQQNIIPLPKTATPMRMAENLQSWKMTVSKEVDEALKAITEPHLARRRDPDNIDF